MSASETTATTNPGWAGMWAKSVAMLEAWDRKTLDVARHEWASAVLGRPMPTWKNMADADVGRLWWAAHGWEGARALASQGDGTEKDELTPWESLLWTVGFPDSELVEWQNWCQEAVSPFLFDHTSLWWAAKGAQAGYNGYPKGNSALWPYTDGPSPR